MLDSALPRSCKLKAEVKEMNKRWKISPTPGSTANTALEISPHGMGLTTIYVCACTLYTHTNRLITEAVYACAYQSL